MTMTNNYNPPFTSRRAWQGTGLGDKPVPTCNVYNSFGVVVARTIDEGTAIMIAEALNAIPDALRWRQLPAYIEPFQIDYLNLKRCIDTDLTDPEKVAELSKMQGD
jgi:hypothetical protein